MARWSNDEERWIFYKAIDDGTLKVPKRGMSNLEFCNPKLKHVIVFEQNGHLEYYEDDNGIIEFDSVAEAEAEIPTVKQEFPKASNVRRTRWSLHGYRPKITWVLTYQLDGCTEFFENWDGVAEYNSKAEATSVIGDVMAEYLLATNWKVIRHPLK